MYYKRIIAFVILSTVFLLVCLLRLTQLQLRPDSPIQDEIAELKLQRGYYRQLKTVRGKILDRKARVLAGDEPEFQLHINYRLSSVLDERVRQGKLLTAAKKPDADITIPHMRKEFEAELEKLQQLIDKCTYFGFERQVIENKIKNINNRIWNLRISHAWRQNCQNSDLYKRYKGNLISVKASDFIPDFEKHLPDTNDRLIRISTTNIAEMHKSWPLLLLQTDDDIFTAQLEFMDVDGIEIRPEARRFYPYNSVAAQTIGWVGPEHDSRLFAEDRLSSYLEGEVSGRRPGAEYVCETILRGRRGEVFYDIDGRRISQTETRFGKNVSLALDIELQQRIEEYLAYYEHDPNCKEAMAAVVIEVATGDVLALVSMPTFDLNRIRYDYRDIAEDPNEPLRNRAINKQYPPGSVVKPLILIAGLEARKISADEIIPCPAQKAPKGWPSCWLYNKYNWMGHDDKGPNNAHNAVKGSCNIYFSRLANRIEPRVLQQWLFKFGYGHNCLLSHLAVRGTEYDRNLRQAQGQISNTIPKTTISDSNQLPILKNSERRFFGIGQGNLRVTPLQVANAMAAIARGGLYKRPRLFIETDNDPEFGSTYLNISPQTLQVVYDGMSAVVNESGGTANKEFAPFLAGFARQGVKVYGKTGSTEAPENAWFAGFAEDGKGRSISIAVVVEGGQHGSSDAAPLARDIIRFCIDAEYIGRHREPDITQ